MGPGILLGGAVGSLGMIRGDRRRNPCGPLPQAGFGLGAVGAALVVFSLWRSKVLDEEADGEGVTLGEF